MAAGKGVYVGLRMDGRVEQRAGTRVGKVREGAPRGQVGRVPGRVRRQGGAWTRDHGEEKAPIDRRVDRRELVFNTIQHHDEYALKLSSSSTPRGLFSFSSSF